MVEKLPVFFKIMGAYSILTLGLVVENKAEFYLKEDKGVSNDFAVFLSVRDDVHKFFVPLIVWLSWNKEPHSLDFLLKTKNAHVTRVKLTRMALTSENMEEKFVLEEECLLSSSDTVFYDFSGYSYGKIAKAKVSHAIDKENQVKISLYYTVYFDNREPQNLSSEWTGKAKRKVKISTGIIRLIQGIGSSKSA